MEQGIRTVILLWLLLSGVISIYAQPCLPNGVVFYSQTAIDNFQANYPDCTEIEGYVFITNNSSPEITNLNGLSVLTSIGGALDIEDIRALSSLSGLNNLESIGGNFMISDCDSLVDISALERLKSIGGGLHFDWNDMLITLSGLDSLTIIGGRLEIYSNYRLSNVSALSNVTSIGGEVNFFNNQSLISLTGLENVTYIGGELYVLYNDSLCSLTGLDNIDAASIQGLQIYGNSCLSECDVLSICSYLESPNGTPLIYDNVEGCNSVPEVEEECEWIDITEISVKPTVSVHPNPFTTSTTIQYEPTDPSQVQLTIYNAIGEEVYKAEDRIMSEGKHSFVWSSNRLPEGLYYAVLRSEEGVSVVKIVKQ